MEQLVEEAASWPKQEAALVEIEDMAHTSTGEPRHVRASFQGMQLVALQVVTSQHVSYLVGHSPFLDVGGAVEEDEDA